MNDYMKRHYSVRYYAEAKTIERIFLRRDLLVISDELRDTLLIVHDARWYKLKVEYYEHFTETLKDKFLKDRKKKTHLPGNGPYYYPSEPLVLTPEQRDKLLEYKNTNTKLVGDYTTPKDQDTWIYHVHDTNYLIKVELFTAVTGLETEKNDRYRVNHHNYISVDL
jgi:hypothetical protein